MAAAGGCSRSEKDPFGKELEMFSIRETGFMQNSSAVNACYLTRTAVLYDHIGQEQLAHTLLAAGEKRLVKDIQDKPAEDKSNSQVMDVLRDLRTNFMYLSWAQARLQVDPHLNVDARWGHQESDAVQFNQAVVMGLWAAPRDLLSAQRMACLAKDLLKKHAYAPSVFDLSNLCRLECAVGDLSEAETRYQQMIALDKSALLNNTEAVLNAAIAIARRSAETGNTTVPEKYAALTAPLREIFTTDHGDARTNQCSQVQWACGELAVSSREVALAKYPEIEAAIDKIDVADEVSGYREDLYTYLVHAMLHKKFKGEILPIAEKIKSERLRCSVVDLMEWELLADGKVQETAEIVHTGDSVFFGLLFAYALNDDRKAAANCGREFPSGGTYARWNYDLPWLAVEDVEDSAEMLRSFVKFLKRNRPIYSPDKLQLVLEILRQNNADQMVTLEAVGAM